MAIEVLRSMMMSSCHDAGHFWRPGHQIRWCSGETAFARAPTAAGHQILDLLMPEWTLAGVRRIRAYSDVPILILRPRAPGSVFTPPRQAMTT
jgi:hypothetical protein